MDYINSLINKYFNTTNGINYLVQLIKEKYPNFKINEDNLKNLKIVEIPEEEFLEHHRVGIYKAKKNEISILTKVTKFDYNITEEEILETFLHELIHCLTSYLKVEDDLILEGINFRKISDNNCSFFVAINEGITQLIVNDILKRNSDAYVFETHIAGQLSCIIGKEKLIECYSGNKFETIVNELENIDKEFDVQKFIIDVYAEYLILINAVNNGIEESDKTRVASIEDRLLELYLKTNREYDDLFFDSLMSNEEAESIINFEESVNIYGRQDISKYGLGNVGGAKEKFKKLIEKERGVHMGELVYENKEQELVAHGYEYAKEMERRINSGAVLKDVVDDNGERTVVTLTEIGTYGYAVFEKGCSQAHYYAEGKFLIDDLTKIDDCDGVALRYPSAKSRVQRNLIGEFTEYIKDPGFHSLYINIKFPKTHNVQVAQRMAGYNPQDPVVITSFHFDKREFGIAADAQLFEENGKTIVRFGMGGLTKDGFIDYEFQYEMLRQAEVAKGAFGEAMMTPERLKEVHEASSKAAQSLLYGVYQTFDMPIMEGVKPCNLLMDPESTLFPINETNKLN